MNKWMYRTLFLVGLTVYFNTGWVLGTYIHEKIHYVNPPKFETAIDKFMAGPYMMFNNHKVPEERRNSKLESQFMFSIIWPVFILIYISSWILYGLWLLLPFVFAGGLAKLFGIG